MGDRGNVQLVWPDGSKIYLYTHWEGTELPSTVKEALKRGKDRWDDPSYLARIIFCEMVKDDQNGLTGFGISPSRNDYNHEDIVLIWNKKMELFVNDVKIEDYLKLSVE